MTALVFHHYEAEGLCSAAAHGSGPAGRQVAPRGLWPGHEVLSSHTVCGGLTEGLRNVPSCKNSMQKDDAVHSEQ